MKQTVPLGRVAGIPVGMHWSVLIMVIMIGWLLGGQVLPETAPGQPAAAYWAVAVPCVVALLAHELAHSLVARRYGVPVTSITLWALGGFSELGGEPPTARADLRIAAAGPATSLAAGLTFGGRAATPLLARPPLAGDLAAIVISDGRITGIVTVSRLRQIIRREALRAPSAR